MELTLLGDDGEDLLLNRSRLELDPVENGRVEEVDAGIDSVADELDGLLDESVDDGRVGLLDNDTVGRGLGNLGHHDGTLASVSAMEGAGVSEWVE